MNKEQAASEVVARARDFAQWASIEGSPYQKGHPYTDNYVTQCATFVRENFVAATRGDRVTWSKGGWKRQTLGQAFEVLGLPPLAFE